VLLNSPGAFDAYLIGSPSIWGEPGLLEQARTFVAPTRTKVVIGVGESEALLFNDSYHQVGNAGTLAALLQRREANIDLAFRIVPEVGHMGVIPTLFQHGFHLLLGPPARP
jgi:predicted alpha/beta superfamily hydrolase